MLLILDLEHGHAVDLRHGGQYGGAGVVGWGSGWTLFEFGQFTEEACKIVRMFWRMNQIVTYYIPQD